MSEERGIRIEGVTKRYGGARALDNVSLAFEAGKIHALLGRNGAGKSTLLGIASNRLFPTSGRVLVDGEPVTENPSALAKVYAFGPCDLYPETMRVDRLYRNLAAFHEGFDPHAALSIAQRFGLEADATIDALSTGYRTVYRLAIALATTEAYLLLDEPVLGLDANARELFYRLLLEDYLEKQRTIIVATHLIEEVANLVEQVTVIDHGRVLLQASSEELRASGYSVSGRAADVDAYCEGREVLGIDELGGLKVAYLQGAFDVETGDERLTLAPMSLQKLFVKLTEGSKR